MIKNIQILLILIVCYNCGITQGELTDLNVMSNSELTKFEINYNLNSFGGSKYFQINVSAFSGGMEYKLNEMKETVVGNIGNSQLAGPLKKIKWTASNSINLSNTLFFKLEALPYSKFKSQNYYIKSILVPGWGTGALFKGKMNKIIAIGSYLLIGSGIGLYIKAKSDYNSYLVKNTANESEQLYSKSINNLKIANYCFAGFGALSIMELIRLNIGIKKIKKKLEYIDNNYYLPETKAGVVAGYKIWLK